MKKLKISVLISMLTLFISVSFAQSNLSKYAFDKPTMMRSVFTSSLYSFNHTMPHIIGKPLPVLANFHYTAFFCKMELKALNHLGIWVKVHAGDYDIYSGSFIRR